MRRTLFVLLLVLLVLPVSAFAANNLRDSLRDGERAELTKSDPVANDPILEAILGVHTEIRNLIDTNTDMSVTFRDRYFRMIENQVTTHVGEVNKARMYEDAEPVLANRLNEFFALNPVLGFSTEDMNELKNLANELGIYEIQYLERERDYSVLP